jgi:tyrosine-protein kinase Etk/Wzc
MNSTIDSKKPGSDGGTGRSSPHESTIAQYLSMVRRGKEIILWCLIVVTVLAAIYTFTRKPVYESSALVLIDMKGTNGSLPFSLDISGAATVNKITNELEILKSGSMAQAAAQKLLEEKTLPPDNTTRIPVIEFRGEHDSSMICSQEQIMERLDLIIDFTPVRESDIIKISARSTNPREAALLANVYAESYVERNLTASRTRSRAVREFLQTQGASKKEALDTTETALQAYMHNSGTVSLDDETKKVVEQLSQLEASRDAIQVDMKSREKTLASYKEELARQEPAVARSIGESNDSYVRLLQEELAKLEVQRDVIIAQNPQMVGQKIYLDKLNETERQIASLKGKLQSRTSEFLKSLVPSLPGEGSAAFLAQTKQKIMEQQIELGGLSARERALSSVIADYEKQFNRIPKKSMDLARLQRARLSNEKLYILIEEKYNEAAITEKSEFGYVDIIDPALVPTKPVSPKVAQNMILAVLAGLGLGLITVFTREHLTVCIRTPEDLKRFGFRTVSIVGRMVGDEEADSKSSIYAAGIGPFDSHLVSFHVPFSPLAQSYRNLRTNVEFAQRDRPLRSVMVTSANPSEGKSTTAANLAITFAQAGKRVLLVDADMYKPALHLLFNIRRLPGLSDYILGNSTFDKVVQKKILDHLDIICSGMAPPAPVEIPRSENMKALFKLALQTYDVVLFDSPPVLSATDASLLASEVDGTVLVVSYDSTRAPEVDRAMESLESVGARVLGVLLNKFDVAREYGAYVGGSGRAYGYGQYVTRGTDGYGHQKAGELKDEKE